MKSPLAAAWLVSMVIASTAGAQPLRAGVAITTERVTSASIAGVTLAEGDTVTLVSLDDPQRVAYAVVVERLTQSNAMTRRNVPSPYYRLGPASGSTTLPDLALVIVGRIDVVGPAPPLVLRADDGRMLRARGCASQEGLHLTVWAGEPLRSARLWHTYVSLGYDVEPTCSREDY